MTKRPWPAAERALRARQTEARQQARIEDVEWLIQFDHNAESVARRAGFPNAEAAERYLHRVGRHDLARKMRIYRTNQDVYHDNYGCEAFGAAA